MIDDVFVENIIKREKTTANRLFTIMSVIATVLLIFFLNAFPILLGYNIIFLTGIISFGLGYLCYWLNKRQNVEYETSLTNDEFTLTRIYNESKRELITEFKIKECKRIAPLTADTFKSDLSEGKLTLNATRLHDYAISDNNWYCLVDSDGYKFVVIFEFQEKMYKAFRRYNPRATKPMPMPVIKEEDK